MAEASDDSVSRSEILAQFQDITGCTDVEKCSIVLERHNWDIETAVQDTLNEAEGSQPVFHPLENSFDGSDQEDDVPVDSSATHNWVSPGRDNRATPTTSTAVQRPIQSWWLWVLSIPLLPFRFASSVLTDVIRWIGSLLWPSAFQGIKHSVVFFFLLMSLSVFIVGLILLIFSFFCQCRDPYSCFIKVVSRATRTTPLEDVLHFKAEFEKDYGTTHPTFYQGSYSQALNDAKRELRFLLVYLHSSDHQDTEEFCSSTMTNEGFKEYVNGNMLFWAANVKSTEGYRVSRALREVTYPFLALICLRDSRMTVAGRMEGLMSVDHYISLLARLIEDNEPALVAARADRHERTQAQQLRDEQDEAYLESVRADQEKERKKREEEDRKRLEEETKRKKEEAKRNREQSIAQDRVDRKCRLPDEPDSSNADAIRVLIKLSNGKRLERRFLKSNPLHALYDFVFCDEESPAEFVLVSNFPRKIYALDSASEHQTLEDAGIEANALLFVQNIEEESDSD